MRTNEAISAYEKALELRPNYVRTLVNIGLARNNKGWFSLAAESFLNALILNPKTTHIWPYVRQAFLQADRFDLLERLEAKDPNQFRDIFPNLINPNSMPRPSMDTLFTH